MPLLETEDVRTIARAAAPDAVLTAQALAKSFGATRALEHADLELRPGEVLALVGENGSGKSTFVKILAGVHRPSAGAISIGGRTLRDLTPKRALDAGVATVFQDVLVAGPASVLDNLWMGAEGLLSGSIAPAQKREAATAVLERLLGEVPPLDTAIERLPLSSQQGCCIARALLRKPRILVLDEATSALDVETRGRLFALLRSRRAEGMAVLFISHRMDEVAELADRLTVLRSGRTVATLSAAGATTDVLVHHMTGGDHLVSDRGRRHPVSAHDRRAEPVLRARSLVLAANARPVEFELRAGELVGVAGLEGHGQEQFLRALWGGPAPAGEVAMPSPSGPQAVTSPSRARELGVVYVPRDRQTEGVFPALSILENFSASTLGKDSRGGLLRARDSRTRFAPFVNQLGIKLGSTGNLIGTLSGGNQQKVIIARWLAAEPRVLLLNDPTRGIDLNAKRDIYDLLSRLTTAGAAIVMLSTEVDEHVELMDRVLVFREGSVSAELEHTELTRERLIGAYFGAEACGD